MRRFLLFVTESYYPNGGWYDFRGSFDTLEEAKVVSQDYWKNNRDLSHIVDTQTWELHEAGGAVKKLDRDRYVPE